MIMIWRINDLVPAFFIKIYHATTACMNEDHLYIRKMLTNREMVNFQKLWDFVCPQTNFGRHIVITLFTRPSVRLSRFVSDAYLLYYVRQNPKISILMNIGMAKCSVPFSGHCDLDLDPWPSSLRIFVSGVNLSYYLRQESQIWYVRAAWGDKVSRTILGSLWPWPWSLS